MLMDMDMGILSKMLATPVTRVSIIMGRVIAAVVVSVIQALIIFILAAHHGGPCRHRRARCAVSPSSALLGLGFAAFSNGLALLVKRQENVMAVTNLFTMPLMFLSSTMMPGGALPGWLNTVRHFNPVDYAVVGVRGLVLEGYVWSDLWRSLVVLGALSVAAVIFATLMFRRQAE